MKSLGIHGSLYRSLRRGFIQLGAAAMIALLIALAFAMHSSATATYRAAGRMHWRLAAQQLAVGGMETARARLAENPDWTSETWVAERIGRVEIRVAPDPQNASPSGDTAQAGHVDSQIIDIVASVPLEGSQPQVRVRLRARVERHADGRWGDPVWLGWSNPEPGNESSAAAAPSMEAGS